MIVHADVNLVLKCGVAVRNNFTGHNAQPTAVELLATSHPCKQFATTYEFRTVHVIEYVQPLTVVEALSLFGVVHDQSLRHISRHPVNVIYENRRFITEQLVDAVVQSRAQVPQFFLMIGTE